MAHVAMRITRNPYQRAAAVCVLLALAAQLAGAAVLWLPLLTIGLVLACVAYSRRRDYPR